MPPLTAWPSPSERIRACEQTLHARRVQRPCHPGGQPIVRAMAAWPWRTPQAGECSPKGTRQCISSWAWAMSLQHAWNEAVSHAKRQRTMTKATCVRWCGRLHSPGSLSTASISSNKAFGQAPPIAATTTMLALVHYREHVHRLAAVRLQLHAAPDTITLLLVHYRTRLSIGDDWALVQRIAATVRASV